MKKSISSTITDIEKAQKHIVKILCKLEMIFLPDFIEIMIHLMLHLPEETILRRPVHMSRMYPYERFLRTLKGYVRNRALPEDFIAKSYVAANPDFSPQRRTPISN